MFGFSILSISEQFLPVFNGIEENLILYIDQAYYKNNNICQLASFVLTIDRSQSIILS